MDYFRFTRQWLCASECMKNDVMAITDKDVIEVEIKISKQDLWHGEARKYKHKQMLDPGGGWGFAFIPNRFYICVPTYLEDEAKKWVEQTNKKYGIIRFYPDVVLAAAITIAKTAQTIKEAVNENLKRTVMMRVCAENIGLMKKTLKGENPNDWVKNNN